MAKPVIVNHATDEDFRRELARTSVCEIADIVAMLDGQLGDGDGSNLWRGVRLRLKTLTSAAISALDDDLADTQELADKVYGEGAWLLAEDKEAIHG